MREAVSLSEFYHFSGSFERAHFRKCHKNLSIGCVFYTELKSLVRINPVCVFYKTTNHSPFTSFLEFSYHLLNLDNHEFCWFERCKAYQYVNNSQVSVSLRGSLGITFDKECLIRRSSLKRTLPEQTHHIGPDIEPYPCPQRLVVWFKDNPFCTAKEGFLNHQSQPTDWDVFPF